MNMNRRTFLKAVGVTIALTITPVMAKTELQWTRYTDQMPKIGQNIIDLSVSNWKNTNGEYTNTPKHKMVIGRVEVDDYDWTYYNKVNNQNVKNHTFALRPQATVYINGLTKGRWEGTGRNVHWQRTVVGDSFSYSTDTTLYPKHEIEELEWVNPVETYIYTIKNWKVRIYNMEGRNRYWMPITSLPKQLPEFPPFQERNIN